MASESRQVRTRQLEQNEKALSTRLATLAEKGLDQKKQARDKVVRHLKAELTASRKRVAAIDAKEALVKELVAKKEAKKAEKAKKLSGKAKAKQAKKAETAKPGKGGKDGAKGKKAKKK